MSKIEIHIITYNEQIMLPFTIAHYRKMFDNPVIIVHDNNSTDGTIAIAEKEGCIVIPFETGGMNDTIQSRIKSEAAMNATNDWVLCIDCDEECFINTADLNELEQRGVNVVQFEGWNIFDEVPSPWDVKVPMGVKTIGYDKPILFKSGDFNRIELAPGAHSLRGIEAKEDKKVLWSQKEYKLLHYKHWSYRWNIQRSSELAVRQSEENKSHNYSYHFGLPEHVHHDFFQNNFNSRVVITDKLIP